MLYSGLVKVKGHRGERKRERERDGLGVVSFKGGVN